jgi:ubiquitin carboxyl-terminal hydrolase L5
LAITALDALKASSKTRTAKPPPLKTSKVPAKKDIKKENEEESYHFIGYVPAFGKVWELVGFVP